MTIPCLKVSLWRGKDKQEIQLSRADFALFQTLDQSRITCGLPYGRLRAGKRIPFERLEFPRGFCAADSRSWYFCL